MLCVTAFGIFRGFALVSMFFYISLFAATGVKARGFDDAFNPYWALNCKGSETCFDMAQDYQRKWLLKRLPHLTRELIAAAIALTLLLCIHLVTDALSVRPLDISVTFCQRDCSLNVLQCLSSVCYARLRTWFYFYVLILCLPGACLCVTVFDPGTQFLAFCVWSTKNDNKTSFYYKI